MSVDSDYYSLKTQELLYETLKEFKDRIFQRMAEKADFNIDPDRLEALWNKKVLRSVFKTIYKRGKFMLDKKTSLKALLTKQGLNDYVH